MATKFDLVVVGTGAGAASVATKCRKAGWNVAIVDDRPYGGTCALRGCDPKKVLVGVAEVVDAASRLHGRGLDCVPRVKWNELMRFKRSFTEPVPQKREEGFETEGIATFHGVGRFVDAATMTVGETTLEARRFHLATGARPGTLGIVGEQLLTTSDGFLELEELPNRIVFVGGGYISFELAHLATRAGAEVTIVHRGPRPLHRFDPDLVSLLVERTRKLGIDVQLEAEVDAVERHEPGLRVHVSRPEGKRAIDADIAVHGAGRVPHIDDLALDRAHVQRDARGIVVNEYMQSVSNPAVYAAGDAARGGPPLTPVAALEARVVAANLLAGNHQRIEYPPIPSVVFTLPPLASVGLLEEEAKARGLRHRIEFRRTSGWYFSRRVGEEFSGFKVLVDESTDHVLGAHLLGPQAEELINVFALAMRSGATASDLESTIFAYPTLASNVSHMLSP